jgi:hypothetical protein
VKISVASFFKKQKHVIDKAIAVTNLKVFGQTKLNMLVMGLSKLLWYNL